MEHITDSGRANSRTAVIYNASLARAQRIHALLLLLVPLLTLAILIPFSFYFGVTWLDVAIFGLFYLVTIAGITVGFHRLFTHRAFVAPGWLRILLGGFGSMAAQGSLTYWVANHRRHHSDSDGSGDPHSPHHYKEAHLRGWRGFQHAQFGWAFAHETTNVIAFAKDLLRDPVARQINRDYIKWVLAGLVAPALLGWLTGGSARDAVAGFLWGGPIRLLVAFHATSLVNSAGHLWGRRPHNTGDHSANVWWLAIPTLGEGWHNNHHAFPRSSRFGLRWWQFDAGAALIELLERTGLVSQVVMPAAYRRVRPLGASTDSLEMQDEIDQKREN